MEDNRLIFLLILCSQCGNLIDILDKDKKEEDVLYIDKNCKCGSVNFFIQKLVIKCVTERPFGQEPFFKQDGHEFFI